MYNLFNCLVETIQKVYTFFIKNSNSIFAIFIFILAQKLGFQTSGESTGNAELLSQFIVEGKLIEPVSIVSNRKVWKRGNLYLKIAIKPCYNVSWAYETKKKFRDIKLTEILRFEIFKCKTRHNKIKLYNELKSAEL